MAFTRKKKRNIGPTAFICLLLALGAIFVGAGVSEAVVVENFEKLSDIINNINDGSAVDPVINITVGAINFPAGEIMVNRDVTISGIEDGKSVLSLTNGEKTNTITGISSFFKFNVNLTNIQLTNLEFSGGRNNSDGGAICLGKETTSAFRNVSFSNNIAGNKGGAIYLGRKTTSTFRNVSFSNNMAVSNGGAIRSSGDAKNISNLTFNGTTLFENNESGNIGGGAIFANYSNLTFGGEVTFNDNSSSGHGGAIYLNSQSGDIGYFLNLKGTAKFFKNKSTGANGQGGAICSQGTAKSKHTLIFGGTATFEGNESSRDHGGAIYVSYSDLTFSREATFSGNSSFVSGGAIYLHSDGGDTDYFLNFKGTAKFFKNKSTGGYGGAIRSRGTAKSRHILIFGGAATFEGNESSGDCGGAIFADHSDLTFYEEATFSSNSSSGNSGAIYARYSDLTFYGKATFSDNSSSKAAGAIALVGAEESIAELTFQSSPLFERNRANQGAAICVEDNVKALFSSGLKLISNSTGYADSGAIHMDGFDEARKVIVTIVQNDPDNPTEIRGNTSGDKGQNAFYLQRHAELNFTLEKGDIYLYDAIEGSTRKESDETDTAEENKSGVNNTVKINGSGGWFNLRRGGTIGNVDLINSGNLSLASPDATELNLKDFSNSGRIKFGISPVDGKCSKIIADKITLGEETTLEILARRGTYEIGQSYDILNIGEVSNGSIADNNIIPISPQNIKAEGKLSDNRKTYHIVIKERITIEKNPPEMRLLSQLTNLDENQDNIIDALNNIYEINPGEESIKKLLDDLEKIKDHEDQKTALSQLSPAFIADTINLSLIGDSGGRQMEIVSSKNKIYLEPHLRRSDGILSTSESGATLGASYRFEQLQFLTLGMQISMHRNSLSGNYGSRANINSGGLAILASLENRLATLSLALGYRRNSYSIDRSTEKLNEISPNEFSPALSSKFSSNAISFSLELGKKFKIPSYSLELYSFLGIRTAILAHDDFSEEAEDGKEYLALEIQGRRYTLLSSNFGLRLSTTLGQFTPSLSLGGNYLIVSPHREIIANFRNHPDHKFQNESADLGRFSPFLDLALGYNLPKNLNLSGEFSYSGNSSRRVMGVGFRAVKGF